MGTLSRPLDTAAALFLKRFMTGYLMQHKFFADYLDVHLQVALDALATHVPSMKDADMLLTQADPLSTTTGNEEQNKAAKGRDSNGYTKDEHELYGQIKEDATKYFLQVIKGLQETTDSVRDKTVHFATMTAWTNSEETEAAAAACAAAVALIPTITSDTMDALIEKKTAAVSEKIAKKAAIKAVNKHIAQQLGSVKNNLGGGKAKSTQPKKRTGTTPKGGPNSKQQLGTKRKQQHSHDRAGKKRQPAQPQRAQQDPPTHAPTPTPYEQQEEQGTKRKRASRRKEHRRKKRIAEQEKVKENRQLYNLTEGRIANSIAAAERRCVQSYGFTSDPTKPLWTNVTTALSNMHPITYFSRPSNMAFHYDTSSATWSRQPSRTGPQVLHPVDLPKVDG
jgi:hypothetical protein